MNTGTIKTLTHERMFGFIRPDAGGNNIFFHFSRVAGSGAALEVGDEVEYEPGTDRTGRPCAIKVRRI